MSHSQLVAKLQSIPGAAGRVWAILTWARQLTDSAIDAMGGNAAVSAQVGLLFDTYVRPLDIPFVPNLLEPAVDEAIKQALIALVWAVDDEG